MAGPLLTHDYHYILAGPDCIGAIFLRVDNVHRTGNARVEGMDRTRDLNRPFRIEERRAHQGRLHRPGLVGEAPRAEVPGGRYHQLVVSDGAVSDLQPVADGTARRFIQTVAG